LITLLNIYSFSLPKLGIVTAIKRTFNGVAVKDAKLLEHYQSTCVFFFLLIRELAVIKAEAFVFLVQQVWHNSD